MDNVTNGAIDRAAKYLAMTAFQQLPPGDGSAPLTALLGAALAASRFLELSDQDVFDMLKSLADTNPVARSS